MKTTLKWLTIIICLISITSCKKEKPIVEEPGVIKKPGSFALIALNDKNKTTDIKSLNEANTSSFSFGDLKASKGFNFILINGGEEPIFNVHLSTDNPAFIANPSTIATIAGGGLINNQENTGLLQLINIGVIHGTQLNGVGFAPLLPMGINTSTLTITGKTLSNGDTLNINATFTLSVDAKVMDIKLYQDSNEIDLTSPSGLASSGISGLSNIRVYFVNSSSILSIKNIGNVPIDVLKGSMGSNLTNLFTLSPMDSASFTDTTANTIIKLKSNGTITDYSRIQLGDDGNGYFLLSY